VQIKKLGKKFPPIAWRDQKLRELREKNRALSARAARSSGSAPWAVPPLEVGQDLLRRSGLFDEAWYRRQLDDDLPAGTDLIEHYLTTGADLGFSAHPAFVSDWYLREARGLSSHASRNNVGSAALLHYLTIGAGRGLSPHPMFDAAWYAEVVPKSGSHPGGPMGHFLAGPVLPQETPGLEGSSPGRTTRWRDPQEFRAAAQAVAEVLLDSRGYLHLERDRPDFDVVAEQTLKDELRAQTDLPEPPALVSIVIPTKDRSATLVAAVDSVLAQTYARWQLVVVDDGGSDDTEQALGTRLQDERISYLRHAESRGVAGARNTGLEHAVGDYVTYLDSDNTWRPDYVELMVRFMRRDGHRVAYAMSALVEQGGAGRVLYRGMPYSKAALEERNYIDCIVLMHERSVLEAVGVFDESLRRNVDWELFIRMAQLCEFGFLPIIATEYDVWEERTQRITTDEPMSYRYVVRQRALVDWAVVRSAAAERIEELVSVVIVATGTAERVLEAVTSVRASARGPVEVVLVDSRLSDSEAVMLQFGVRDAADTQIIRLTQVLPLELARNVGATRTRGSTLVFLPEQAWCEAGWDLPLVQALQDYAAVQPVILTSGGAVWSAGVAFLSSGRSVLPFRGFSGDAPEVRGLRTVDGASALCLAVRAESFADVEGFDPLFVGHFSGSELSIRLSEHTGLPAACTGGSVVALRTDLPNPTKAASLMAARGNDRRMQRLWEGRPSTLQDRLGEQGYAVEGFLRARNTEIDPTPLLIHQRPQRPLRWAIKIGPPNVARRTNWGDWHFAVALRESLERLGHEVSIDCKEEWYRSSAYLDDVVLVLRGVSIYEVNPGHTNISWVISHPERVTAAEMSDYDLVFGASPRWCERIAGKLAAPAEVLLQCTDQHRFHPVEPDRRRAHPVLAVANARSMRPSVGAALEAGVVPAVYGLRWGGLLPEGAWLGEYIPNDELAAVYAAAGVVLNDHWDDMRSEGLLSNRLFDLVACNARVISDDLPEIHDVFGDVVLTFTSAQDIPDLVATHLHESPQRRARREAMGEQVRREHTFDARARMLTDRVAQLRTPELAPAK